MADEGSTQFRPVTVGLPCGKRTEDNRRFPDGRIVFDPGGKAVEINVRRVDKSGDH